MPAGATGFRRRAGWWSARVWSRHCPGGDGRPPCWKADRGRATIMTTTPEATARTKRPLWRRLTWLGSRVLFVYVGVIVVLVLLENYLLFHPTKATAHWDAPPNGRVEDVWIHSADGNRLHAWWCPT